MKLLILGNSENRRVSMMEKAWRKETFGEVTILHWEKFLNDRGQINSLLETCDVLKIESSGENWEVEKKLIEIGSDNVEAINNDEILFSKGQIRLQNQWYNGWCEIMEDLTRRLSQHSIVVMNSPASLKVLFDKYRWSKDIAATRKIPTSVNLGLINGFDDFLDKSGKKGRYFIKPCHSSSASGILAVHINGSKILIQAPVETQGDSLYNTLKIRKYTSFQEARFIIDSLCNQKVYVEKWFPKASFNGHVYDLRVVTTAGQATHAVMRTSKGPITNLHLGNARGDINALIKHAGSNWSKVTNLAEKVARAHPDTLYLGIDIMVSQDFLNVVVAEANGFGDLLPSIIDSRGRSTYEAQAHAMYQSLNPGLTISH